MVSVEYVLYALRWAGSKSVRLGIIAATASLLVVGIGSISIQKLNPNEANTKIVTSAATLSANERILMLEKQVSKNPQDMTARADLIDALIQVGKHSSALAMLRASDNKARDSSDRIAFARSYMHLGENKSARTMLEQATLDPAHAFEALLLSGEASLRLRDYEKVLKTAEKIRAYPEATFLMARAQYAMGDSKLAKALIESVDEESLRKRNLFARVSLFKIQMALHDNDTEKAALLISQSAESGESAWSHRIIDIEIAIREGRFEDAQNWLNAIDENAREKPSVQEVIAHFYTATGEYRQASQILDGIADWSGGSLRRPILHALVKSYADDKRQARHMLHQHLKTMPNDWQALYIYSGLSIDEGLFEVAQDLVADLSRVSPTPIIAAFRNFELALAKQDYDLATDILDEIIWRDNYSELSAEHLHVKAMVSLVGAQAKAVHQPSTVADIFRRQLAVRYSLKANRPEKSLALIEQALAEKPFVNPLDKLAHAQILLANFKDDEAHSVLLSLPESVLASEHAYSIALRLKRRGQNIELESRQAISTIFDALRTNDTAALREAVRSGQNVLDDPRVLSAIGKAIVDGQIELNSDRLFIEKIASRLATLRGGEHQLLAARLFKKSDNAAYANQVYREAIMANPGSWMVYEEFLEHPKSRDEKASAAAFLKVLQRERPATDKNASDMMALARVLLQAGDPKSALKLLEDRKKTANSYAYAMIYAHALSKAGLFSKAQDVILREMRKEQPAERIYESARTLRRIGATKEAADLLEAAITGDELTSGNAFFSKISGELRAEQIDAMVNLRSALILDRKGSISRQEQFTDLAMARWSLLLSPVGYLDRPKLVHYSTALRRAGYKQQAELISKEIMPQSQEVPKKAHSLLQSGTGEPSQGHSRPYEAEIGG